MELFGKFYTITFQFYLSSIKSTFWLVEEFHVVVFQFYLSSIKSKNLLVDEKLVPSFNSTLVQLKVVFQFYVYSEQKQFQFYLSSIKRMMVGYLERK